MHPDKIQNSLLLQNFQEVTELSWKEGTYYDQMSCLEGCVLRLTRGQGFLLSGGLWVFVRDEA